MECANPIQTRSVRFALHVDGGNECTTPGVLTRRNWNQDAERQDENVNVLKEDCFSRQQVKSRNEVEVVEERMELLGKAEKRLRLISPS